MIFLIDDEIVAFGLSGKISPLHARLEQADDDEHLVGVGDDRVLGDAFETLRAGQVRVAREDLLDAWRKFRALPQERRLPSAPAHPIVVREEKERPQPKFDVNAERGMATVIGRVRPCPVLQFKYMALSHNTIRGAAGAALLNAELMKSEGYLD